MIWIRPEGTNYRYGLNLYPWSERAYSVGFILRLRHWRWRVRYAPKTGTFYNSLDWCETICEERQAFDRWSRGY